MSIVISVFSCYNYIVVVFLIKYFNSPFFYKLLGKMIQLFYRCVQICLFFSAVKCLILLVGKNSSSKNSKIWYGLKRVKDVCTLNLNKNVNFGMSELLFVCTNNSQKRCSYEVLFSVLKPKTIANI